MPVVTRNQYKNNAIINKIITPIPDDILSWFITIVSKKLKNIHKLHNNKSELRILIKDAVDTHRKNAYKKELKSVHYDKIREVSELMYIISEYFPKVMSLSSDMSRFGQFVYNKVQSLYLKIRKNKFKPETGDELKTIKSMIYILQDTEKIIIPFLPNVFQVKRIRNFVDYSGMDTDDNRIDEDEDYDPIEDVEDDEEVEELDEDDKSKKNVQEPRKVWKSKNHILFEYDD
jgi:hypothetical protein